MGCTQGKPAYQKPAIQNKTNSQQNISKGHQNGNKSLNKKQLKSSVQKYETIYDIIQKSQKNLKNQNNSNQKISSQRSIKKQTQNNTFNKEQTNVKIVSHKQIVRNNNEVKQASFKRDNHQKIKDNSIEQNSNKELSILKHSHEVIVQQTAFNGQLGLQSKIVQKKPLQANQKKPSRHFQKQKPMTMNCTAHYHKDKRSQFIQSKQQSAQSFYSQQQPNQKSKFLTQQLLEQSIHAVNQTKHTKSKIEQPNDVEKINHVKKMNVKTNSTEMIKYQDQNKANRLNKTDFKLQDHSFQQTKIKSLNSIKSSNSKHTTRNVQQVSIKAEEITSKQQINSKQHTNNRQEIKNKQQSKSRKAVQTNQAIDNKQFSIEQDDKQGIILSPQQRKYPTNSKQKILYQSKACLQSSRISYSSLSHSIQLQTPQKPICSKPSSNNQQTAYFLEESGYSRRNKQNVNQEVSIRQDGFKKIKWQDEEIPNEKSVNMQLKIRTYLNAEAI